MAVYGTDLTTMTDAESGTWTEMSSPYNAGGSPALDGENFIQGSDCYSQTTGTKSGLVFSLVFDYGSALTFATDDVVLVWTFYAVGANLETYANGGMRLVIGSNGSIDNANAYAVGGSDYARNPYGGWMNVAVDPTRTADYTIGTGNAGSYRYFGMMPYTLASISKGTPHAVDAIRYGRGEIYCIGTGCNFADMAYANDLNSASAFTGDTSSGVAQITNINDVSHLIVGMEVTGTNIPAATTITAISGTTATISNNASGTGTGISFSQYNRLGLFQDTGGTYLSKGLLSFGQTGTSVTFSDSNVNILLDDAAKTYATFNKIEINNASSSVTLTNVSFTSLGTVAPGYFEMVANATVAFTGCVFNQMTGTHIYQSNATVLGCIYNSCGKITVGGADFTGSKVLESAVAADNGAINWNVATNPDGYLDDMEFSKGANAHHAIEFGTSAPLTMTLRGIVFGTEWNAANGNNDSTLLFPDTGSDVTWNISLVGCTGTITYKKARAGDTVNLIIDPVTTTITVRDIETNGLIQNARVLLVAADGTGDLPYQATVTIAYTGTTATVTHTAHGMATGDIAYIYGCNESDLNGAQDITVTGVNTYTYTIPNIGTGSATGTPKSTGGIFNELTNASGIVTDSRSITNDQPVKGRVRKMTTSPVYKNSPINETIDNVNGLAVTVYMIPDE